MNSIDDIELVMKRQGGIEALERLKKYLNWCGTQKEIKDEAPGLQWALDAIDFDIQRLSLQQGGYQ